MLILPAKIRKELGKKVRKLREKGIIPAILYGPEMISDRRKKALPLGVDEKQFEKIYQKAKESILISLNIEGQKKKPLVLIQDVKRDPLTLRPIHIDFYQPKLKEEIEAKIPLVLEGESLAVKESGGTLIKNIPEVQVKALPQDLPKEIKINIESLKTFEDKILIKDLKVPSRVKILRDPEEIIAWVSPPEKVEEELAKPVEEKVEEVERVVEKKEEEKEEEEKKEE